MAKGKWQMANGKWASGVQMAYKWISGKELTVSRVSLGRSSDRTEQNRIEQDITESNRQITDTL